MKFDHLFEKWINFFIFKHPILPLYAIAKYIQRDKSKKFKTILSQRNDIVKVTRVGAI